MKVIAVNGSPRKKWNTATLLDHALEGARSVGAETELVHLYDLDFKGCHSCFGCKTVDGPSYGHCAVKDGLRPLLEAVPSAGALILGSPIYCMQATGEMRSFYERLIFPYLEYADPPRSLFPGKLKVGLIYDMGMPEAMAQKIGLESALALSTGITSAIFGQPEVLFSYDTMQFDDYSKYAAARFDPVKKKQRHDEVFPEDCKKAFAMGARLAQ